MKCLAQLSFLVPLLIGDVLSQEQSPFRDLPPTEPLDAIATFDLHPDFKIELVASEPLIADPVAISFNESGALYVVEMRGYSERREEALGRVRRLEDRDHDGRMDHGTTFIEGLKWPTGVLCYDGGIFVLAAPDLWFLKDTTGDGIADEKRIVLTGFSELASRLNVQQLPNNIRWGPDQRIHIAEGGNGSRIRRPDQPAAEVLVLRRQDLVINPRTTDFWTENGGGQFGMAFDSFGRKFVTSNSRHLMQVVYDQTPTNASAHLPPATVDIAEDGPAAPVYRRSPDEGWRVARTKWRVAGLVPGPIEGGGTPSGYFTGATGLQVYTGDQLPDGYSERDVFIADVGSNLIHHKRLDRSGLVDSASRVAPFVGREFLASTDNWFRPVQLENGPSGGLYVVDFYRELIEHPWSLPPGIKEHLDLNRGNDRGRIWRVTKRNSRNIRPVILDDKSTTELIETLGHSNGWQRHTAARLLFEANDPDATRPLIATVRSESAHQRFTALSLLAARDALTEPMILLGLTDPDPHIRSWTLRLAIRSEVPIDWNLEPWRERAISISSDANPNAAFQLLLGMDPSLIDEGLAAVLWRNAYTSGEDYLLDAALPLFERHADQWMPAIASRPNHEATTTALTQMMEISAPKLGTAETIRLLESAAERAVEDDYTDPRILLALATGIVRSPNVAPAVRSQLTPSTGNKISSAFVKSVHDQQLSEEDLGAIADAVQLLEHSVATDALLPLLQTDVSVSKKQIVVNQLLKFQAADILEVVLDNWTFVPLTSRSRVIVSAAGNESFCLLVMNRAEENPEFRAQIGSAFRQAIRSHKNDAIRAKGLELFGPSTTTSFATKWEQFEPALDISGAPELGRVIYRERCALCHRAENEGTAIGPDLLTVAGAGRESLLTNILDPNREVAPRFESWTAELNDGDTISGMLLEQNETQITLKSTDGMTRRVLLSDLTDLSSGGRSLMPEALEEGLSAEQMAGLLRFIEGLANPDLTGSSQ